MFTYNKKENEYITISRLDIKIDEKLTMNLKIEPMREMLELYLINFCKTKEVALEIYIETINIPVTLDNLQKAIKKQIELQKQITILENKINTSIALIEKEIKDWKI